jgi:hypothetical protein
MNSHLTSRDRLLVLISPFLEVKNCPFSLCRGGHACMDGSERRVLKRHNIRTPLRFRTIDLTGSSSDHFTQAMNVSRGGFYFASAAPLKMGMPIEATLRMPSEVTGGEARLTSCTARVVRVKSQAYKDGRVGFGMEIERVHTAEIETPGAD